MSAKAEHLQTPSFLQSEVWAQFKSEFGWRPHRLVCESDHGAGSVSALSRKAGPGIRLAYVPHGAPSGSVSLLADCSRDALSGPGGPLQDCMFLRWDLPWEATPALREELRALGFKSANVDIQPPNTVILDLRKPADELLAEMKSKTRYNIRLAARKGVVVESERLSALNEWYELYRQTAHRDSISIHSQQYYKRLFELIEQSGDGSEVSADSSTTADPAVMELLCARHEGELIAGIVVVYYRGQAVYLYGAGADHKRNLMAAYLLQWSAIERAQARGCLSYDLFGIPPSDDPKHPMHGLYRFKVGFGGDIVQRLGCWDYTRRPALYAGFCYAEAARNWYFKTFRKRR